MRSEAKASGWLQSSVTKLGVLCAVSHTVAQWTSLTLTHVIFFIVECGIVHFLCAMRILEVRASSSSPRSLTHPAYLMPGEPKLFGKFFYIYMYYIYFVAFATLINVMKCTKTA